MPGCALGTDANALGVKISSLLATPVYPAPPCFPKPVAFPWRSLGPAPPPAYGSGHTLAFLQAAAAEITRLGALDKGLCPATSSPWSSSLRGLMAESSGAERGWLRGVVSGQWAGLCAGLRPPAPCHSATTRQRSGDSAPGGGGIQGSVLCVLLPELAWGQPEDIREEVLGEPAELLAGG